MYLTGASAGASTVPYSNYSCKSRHTHTVTVTRTSTMYCTQYRESRYNTVLMEQARPAEARM